MQHIPTPCGDAVPAPLPLRASRDGEGAGAAEPSGVASAATAPPDTGPPPSFRGPANCKVTLLRHGIDSLYLSYKGKLFERIERQLNELKTLAQSDDQAIAALAQLKLGDHLFEVSDRGRRRFAFVLRDNWFNIALSARDTRALPMAHVQLASELLTALGPDAATAELNALIDRLGAVPDPPTISRVDPFVDFVTDTHFESLAPESWVKRAKQRAVYDHCEKTTGIALGLGGDIGMRLYDKTHEVRTISRKDYLFPLWEAAGWNGEQTVWRLEFQLKRQAMPDVAFASLEALTHSLPAIWAYLTTEWVRLTVPNPSDDTRARWPTHPMWEVLSRLGLQASAPSLRRVTKTRAPSDQTLFRQGLWPLTSFMAREGITDLGEGFAEYLRQAERHHRRGEGPSGADALDAYIVGKVRAKARRYNTIDNSGGIEP